VDPTGKASPSSFHDSSFLVWTLGATAKTYVLQCSAEAIGTLYLSSGSTSLDFLFKHFAIPSFISGQKISLQNNGVTIVFS
jgi:hypothetical protein